MNLDAMYHRMKQNWSYAYDEKTLHIRLRTKKDEIDSVVLHCGDKFGWEHTYAAVPMSRWVSDQAYDYWEAAIEPRYRRLAYYFEIRDPDQAVFMLEKGFFEEAPANIYEGLFDFPFLNKADVIQPPAWVKDAVFYQIFPERFANGDPANDPEGVLPWGGAPTPTNFFGGDLQGILDHLDYLSELGINAVYFNPLFQATTNHKYDTQDYFQVDHHFGTNDKLKELVDACHQRGIRVLLDAVFNHCGHTFPPFVDVAENGIASPYADWFHVRQWPLGIIDGIPTYDTFGFEPIMPKFNTENPEVREYLLRAARYWVEEIGIDGWRLDVANEVDHQFWREFRSTVKAVSPDAYLVGEIMHDSMAWLQGDQFDAVMNYPFTNALLNFFAHETIDALAFAHAIQRQLASYPRQVSEASFNLLGSHDTTRLLTLCRGNKERLKLAYLFELTFMGAPCIYYGDEIGLDGEYDPHNRKCMEWDLARQDRELLSFFKTIISLRLKHEALRSGSISFLSQEHPQVLVYERALPGSRFLIAINQSDEPAPWSEDSREAWMDALTGERLGDGRLQSLPAYGFTILEAVAGE